MSNIINFEEMNGNLRKKCEDVKARIHVERLVNGNSDELFSNLCTIAGVGFAAYKTVKGVKDKWDKDRRIYDHGLNRYLQLKRKLNSNDIAIIKERQRNKEKLYYILNDLNLLK